MLTFDVLEDYSLQALYRRLSMCFHKKISTNKFSLQRQRHRDRSLEAASDAATTLFSATAVAKGI
jgi:hypothetical protein